MLGNGFEMSIALCRRGLGRLARHGAGARRHNDRCSRMAFGHCSVDVVPIERAIACEERDRAIDLIEQGPNLGAVIDILGRQLRREDLAGVGVHTEMERL